MVSLGNVWQQPKFHCQGSMDASTKFYANPKNVQIFYRTCEYFKLLVVLKTKSRDNHSQHDSSSVDVIFQVGTKCWVYVQEVYWRLIWRSLMSYYSILFMSLFSLHYRSMISAHTSHIQNFIFLFFSIKCPLLKK